MNNVSIINVTNGEDKKAIAVAIFHDNEIKRSFFAQFTKEILFHYIKNVLSCPCSLNDHLLRFLYRGDIHEIKFDKNTLYVTRLTGKYCSAIMRNYVEGYLSKQDDFKNISFLKLEDFIELRIDNNAN